MFASISNERLRHCGCKSSTFIQLYKPFCNLFLKYFLSGWFVEGYNNSFFPILAFYPRNFEDSSGFERIGTRRHLVGIPIEDDSSYQNNRQKQNLTPQNSPKRSKPLIGTQILQILADYKHIYKVVFFSIILNIYKKENLSAENKCPSPDSSGNPLVPGFGTRDCNG